MYKDVFFLPSWLLFCQGECVYSMTALCDDEDDASFASSIFGGGFACQTKRPILGLQLFLWLIRFLSVFSSNKCANKIDRRVDDWPVTTLCSQLEEEFEPCCFLSTGREKQPLDLGVGIADLSNEKRVYAKVEYPNGERERGLDR